MRPAPTRPKSPTISPPRAAKSMPARWSRSASPSTRSRSAPEMATFGRWAKVAGRPTMCTMRSALVSAFAGWSTISRPSRSTTTRSQCASASSRRWVMKMSPTPWAASSCASANSRSPSAGVSEEVGSSRIRRRGCSAIALASSTSCCSPLRRLPSGVRGSMWPRPTRASTARAAAFEPAETDEAAAVRPVAAEEDVLGDAERAGGRELLVDEADAEVLALAHRAERDRAAGEGDLAGRWREGAGDDVDERRLARAVLADEADDLAGRDAEVDAVQHRHVAEALRDAADLEDGGHGGTRRGLATAAQGLLQFIGPSGVTMLPSTRITFSAGGSPVTREL